MTEIEKTSLSTEEHKLAWFAIAVGPILEGKPAQKPEDHEIISAIKTPKGETTEISVELIWAGESEISIYTTIVHTKSIEEFLTNAKLSK